MEAGCEFFCLFWVQMWPESVGERGGESYLIIKQHEWTDIGCSGSLCIGIEVSVIRSIESK